ncbi:MAG: M23 family metallopeptidase [Tannerellaceae bacterium]|jgi:hypothetical protein|nr:M23 family metallopeptidase [Tannerellaceae bacterium]
MKHTSWTHKAKYGFLTVLGTIALSTCRSAYIHTPPAEAVGAKYPSILPDTPTLSGYRLYAPFTPWEELDIPPLPSVRITENFCYRDINHVSSTDPELFADSDVLHIDLMRLQKAAYSFPLPGAKVISPYGGRRRTHSGTDLKTFAGDTVRAVFDGIVRMAKLYSAYGNVIVIRHFNGMETVYSHNSRNLITQGAYVKSGQPIALTGRTGRATTEHLHFEARINGRPFDPGLLFNWETQTLQENILVCTKNKNSISVSSIHPLLLRPRH